MSKRNDLIASHYLENYTRLVKRARGRVTNNSIALAEEVVQEAYARALKYFRTFNPKTNDFDVWFNSILRNAINDSRTIEQERGCTTELHENIVELVPSTKVDYPAIIKLIGELVPKNKEREVLMLFYIYGYRSLDITEYLALNHNSVRGIILRFKNKVNESGEEKET